MVAKDKGAYGADDELVDYILGITYEIWEERGIELIGQYYSGDCLVHGLDGLSHGAAEMIDGTRAMLEAFPDRLLLVDDVIWSGSPSEGYYSSHRLLSPMTNEGATVFGPATGRKVQVLTIADCVVEDGVITREWLFRDNHALVAQLGYDPIGCAKIVAGNRNDESNAWLATEIERLTALGISESGSGLVDPATSAERFASQLISNNWTAGNAERTVAAYAPYAVQHRSPVELYSGPGAIEKHYAALRDAFDVSGIAVEHVCVQPHDDSGQRVAARWCAAATHRGKFLGLEGTGKPVYLLGSTHWRIESGRVAVEWTVFDGLGVLSQLV